MCSSARLCLGVEQVLTQIPGKLWGPLAGFVVPAAFPLVASPSVRSALTLGFSNVTFSFLFKEFLMLFS